MDKLLPIPSIDYFPTALKGSDDINALADYLDKEFTAWKDETIGLGNLKDPARAPANCLNAFGQWLSAGIADRDEDRTKRAKISNAVENTRWLSTWDKSAKPMIDAVVGGDCSIVSGVGTDDFVICGTTDVPDDYMWSVIGGLDIDEPYGIRIVCGSGYVTYTSNVITALEDQMLICGIDCPPNMYSFVIGGLDNSLPYGSRILGDGTEFTSSTVDYVEPMIKGTLLVDVDSSILTAVQVEALKADLKDIAPCYFKIYLGYMMGTTFIPYANGLVGS